MQVAFDFLILIHILDWKDVVIKYEVNRFHGVWLGIIVDATMVVQGREPLIIPRCLCNLDCRLTLPQIRCSCNTINTRLKVEPPQHHK